MFFDLTLKSSMDPPSKSHGNDIVVAVLVVGALGSGRSIWLQCCLLSQSLLLTSIYSTKMTYKLSYDIKSSALIIALILVPIAVLIFVVVIALACSNYWSIHSLKESCLSCFSLWKQQRRNKIPSDSEACPITPHSTLARATEASDIRIEFERPVTNIEHV